MNIDYIKLRNDLKDYFGTAMYSGMPMAIIELSKIEKASERELINIATKNGFNLNNYILTNDEEQILEKKIIK